MNLTLYLNPAPDRFSASRAGYLACLDGIHPIHAPTPQLHRSQNEKKSFVHVRLEREREREKMLAIQSHRFSPSLPTFSA